MEMLRIVLLGAGSLFIGIGFGTLLRNNKIVAIFLLIGFISLSISNNMKGKINGGKPTSLNILTVGEKYEVVAIYDGKYTVTKSLTDEDENGLRFIGPLVSSDNLSVGDIYIKTAEGSLEKFLRH